MLNDNKFTFDLTDFKCPLCLDLPKNPTESLCCHAIFCKICVITINKCPLCRV